jgi:hypothetical protein
MRPLWEQMSEDRLAYRWGDIVANRLSARSNIFDCGELIQKWI